MFLTADRELFQSNSKFPAIIRQKMGHSFFKCCCFAMKIHCYFSTGSSKLPDKNKYSSWSGKTVAVEKGKAAINKSRVQNCNGA
ncbi:MAG: hypothetical protein B6I22_03800 [Desulfobacteraceae bacterium 4572_123]|nr:MAG: hypothetical protein B6I22_03800 [Desulfobacteraceae bacterium 4572_123]